MAASGARSQWRVRLTMGEQRTQMTARGGGGAGGMQPVVDRPPTGPTGVEVNEDLLASLRELQTVIGSAFSWQLVGFAVIGSAFTCLAWLCTHWFVID